MISINQSNSLLKRSRAIALCSSAMSLVAMVTAALAGGTSSALATEFKVLYSFTGGADGGSPYAALVADKLGNLYGTTSGEGTAGSGTVFRLAPDGTLTTLYAFANNGTDGKNPYTGVILDKAGNIYGTTGYGGPANYGTVFKITPDGTETVLYAFTGESDGRYPFDGLLERHGDLYGMTWQGGTANQYGVVFKVAPDGTETVLHAFKGGKDGSNPRFTTLIADKAGALYGATQQGGTGDWGTVFKLQGHHETVLYSFQGGNDGAAPLDGLLEDAAGNFYGTTAEGGGTGAGCSNNSGCGTVFKLAPDGTETVLHSFQGGNDGATPYASLLDAAGNFYGTTSSYGADDGGTVFKLAPDGTETVLYSLNGGSDGANPFAGLVADRTYQKGVVFGTAYGGGAGQYGTIFSIKK